jgi:hypothetical protein
MRQGHLNAALPEHGAANFAKIGACGPGRCDKKRHSATFTQKMELYVVDFFGLEVLLAQPPVAKRCRMIPISLIASRVWITLGHPTRPLEEVIGCDRK